jgi:hypothetical protein
MPRGPKGERRPEDPAAAAVMAVRVAIGEVKDVFLPDETPKNAGAVERGRLGGNAGGPARAAHLSQEERKKIATKAAEARWRKNV